MLHQPITFGPFRLDPRAGLTRGRRAVRLTPKAFSLLCVLAGERGRVVGKEELFRAVWRGAVVGDTALVTCVQELRRALGDKAGRPRYIETLHRRGYRFIAEPAAAPAAAAPPASALSVAPVFVGRPRELDEIEAAFEAARDGKRQVVLVAGEAGIGKTTLVRAFLSRAAARAPVLAWGQSAEHYGAAEPYHPLLDALSRCCRTQEGAALLAALEAHAPLWLAQMPSLVSPSRLRAVQRRVAGATPQRMQREITEALEAAAAERPLALWLEDLHWADAPTIDWLAAFARRPEAARVLVIGTYRPVEARAGRHALYTLGDELARQGGSRTLTLGPLAAEAVGQYMRTCFPPRPGEEQRISDLALEVHRRTEGSPLFMVGVLGELVNRGVLRGDEAGWSLANETDRAGLGIPVFLRQLIERQIDRLAAPALRVLEAASLAGLRFDAAIVAAALERPIAEVEQICADTARDHGLIVEAGRAEWPDGTLASRFSFVHALYREALAASLPAARGAQLHRRIGERLAEGSRGRAEEVAAQVAMHLERGGDLAGAVTWLRRAGDAAQRRTAMREAAAYFEHALGLVARLPPARSRDGLEVELRLALCAPLIAAHGMGSERVEACAKQALAACSAIGDRDGRFAAHRIVWNNSLMRDPAPTALAHARELMQEARAVRRDVELALAHRALGCSLIYAGEHAEAARLLARGAAIADRVADGEFERFAEQPGMVCRAFGAWPTAFMGLADEAVRLSDESVAHARRRDDPHGLAFALVTVGLVDLFNRDARRADAVAREVQVLSEQHHFAQWIAFAHEIRGWVAFQAGEHEGGIRLMQHALERLHATGARTHSSRVLANLAESCLVACRIAEARRYLEAAFAHREAHGEHYYAPELYRLRALVLRAEGAPEPAARASLREAVTIARRQGARLFEERAALALARQLGVHSR
ncbi:MAG TPA: AAA family ATPase [Burkholderiales bacterium]|nr:AAA family ATPase [Burkholderiales bacterium]